MLPFFLTLLRLLVFSLLVGAGLSFFDITAVEILGVVGLSPMQLWIYLNLFIEWAIPNIILGAILVVPAWIVFLIFRPNQE